MTRSATVEGNVTVTGVATTVAVASDDRGHHVVVAPTTVAATRWVLDPDDDHGCVRALLALHDLAVGVVVCPAAPGSPWPLLAGHVLTALGKDRRALDAAGPRHRVPELLALWLRAEQVQHLVVLRAHLLPHATLVELDRLATDAGVTVRAVAHGDHGVDHTARRAPSAAPVQWTAAVALLTAATATDHNAPWLAET